MLAQCVIAQENSLAPHGNDWTVVLERRAGSVKHSVVSMRARSWCVKAPARISCLPCSRCGSCRQGSASSLMSGMKALIDTTDMLAVRIDVERFEQPQIAKTRAFSTWLKYLVSWKQSQLSS